MKSGEQLNRIVQLVAEMTRRQRDGGPPVTLTELADRFGITVAQVARDIRTLTLLDDESEADWLLSLRVSQQGETVHLNSRGPFRRPVRFTPDELLALSAGLATEEGGAGLAARLAVATREFVSLERSRSPELDCLLDAVTNNNCVEIRYAGEASKRGASRVIQPHQVAAFAGRGYVAAWCERAGDWRHFRTDRIIHARSIDRTFTRRDDFTPIDNPDDLFQEPDGGADDVSVRFSPEIARWILERYPEAEGHADGGVTVRYRVASVEWLVRRILQYGPEAEVLEPAEYREAMRRAVASRSTR